MQGWQRVSDLKKVDVASMQKLSARTKVSLLQQTGYLTIKNATQIDGEMHIKLGVPNTGVLKSFWREPLKRANIKGDDEFSPGQSQRR